MAGGAPAPKLRMPAKPFLRQMVQVTIRKQSLMLWINAYAVPVLM
jgi:hypothetical protein